MAVFLCPNATEYRSFERFSLDIKYYVVYSILRKGVLAMDVQMKRGLLEICVLTVLCRGDSYGYQIIKDIEPCIRISESTLYPILKRLEASGCLTVYSQEHNGRLRKYYRITQAGRDRRREFLREWQEVIRVYEFISGLEEANS